MDMKTKTLFPLLMLALVSWMCGCGKSEPATPPQQVYIDSVDESDSYKQQTAEAAPQKEAAPQETATPAGENTTPETTPTEATNEQPTPPSPAPAEQKPAEKKVFAHSTDGYVNVRSEPNTKSKILGRLTKGGPGARYMETVGEWYKIRYKDSIAYVKATYASFDSI